MNVPAWRCLSIVTIVVIGMCGCSATGSITPTSDRAEPTRSPSEVRYQLHCFFSDGNSAGTFMSLNETWASTNFVRMEYCTAAFVGPKPHSLTPDEQAIAKGAAVDLPHETVNSAFLEIVASCARIPPGDGPHGAATYPVSVLRASTQLCPHAPQAGIVAQQLAGRG